MANRGYFPVFLQISLDTRLVLAVSYEDTVASLKRKIEAEHLVSFPVNGEIIVRAVKTLREGIMYHLSDSMPVSAVLSGVNGTLLLYIEAVTTNYKRILTNGRVDQEVKVPIGGRSEDLMVSEAPSIDKEVFIDPLHDSAEDPTHILNKTKKKKRKKNLSSEDTALRLEELRKGEAEGFEGNSAQEEPVSGGVTRKEKKHKKSIGFYLDAASEVPRIKENEPQVKDNIQVSEKEKDSKVLEKPGGTTKTPHSVSFELYKNRGNQEGNSIADKAIGSDNQPQNDQNVVSDDIQECRKENGSEIFIKESANAVGEDPGFVSPEKKKRKKTKAAFMEATSQELSSIENGCYKEKATDAVLEQEKSKAGDANFINNAAEELKHDTHTSCMDEAVKEKSRKKHKKTKGPSSDIPCEVPPIRGDESEKADDKVHEGNRLVDKERNSEIPLKSAGELKHDTHNDTSGMDEAVKENSRKKRKKTKGLSSDIPCEVPPIREDDSEKADDKVHEGNRLVDKDRNFEIPLKSGAAGGGAEADNSVPCKLDKERLQPEINSPADEDLRFHNQLRQQASMGDSKEESRKDVGFSKEAAHVTCRDPEVFSVEKKSRKKKKAASIEGLVQEAIDNKSGPERENDTILEKKTSKEAVDIGLINITGRDPGIFSVERRNKKNKAATDGMGKKQSTEENGSCKERESNLNMEKEISKGAGDAISSAVGDPGVACKEKRKHKKTKAAATDASSQELPATKNDSSNERKSSLIVDKVASNEAGDAHFTKNAGDVTFPASNCADPDDSNKIVSDVLADLRERSPIPPDTQVSEDAASHLQFLANVAVDHHKAEQASEVIVKTKKERRKSKKESSNKTETLQDTMDLVTVDSVVAPDEKKRHKTAEVTSLPPERENGVDSGENFVLASSQEDGARNQTLGSNIVEESVNDGNKKKIKEQEATTLGSKATIHGAALEANGTIKDSIPQTHTSGKKEPQTKIKESLKEDNLVADLTFVDEKSSKGKPKEKGVTDKHGVMSIAEETTQNAPTTPEKMQKSVDNFLAEKQDKEAFAEAIQTKGSAIFHTPATEKINFIDYFLLKPTVQPSDATSPLKETKVNKKIQNNSFSKDKSKSHTSLSNDVSKRDDKMKHLLAGMAVMSDVSTEDDEEVKSQLRRPMLAVRKVSGKNLSEKTDASRKNSAVVSSGTCFDDSASEASTRDESGSANRGSPKPGKKKGRAMTSPSSCWKDEGISEDDLPMSQESTKPKKKVNLSSVLRSSSSYKKAKVSASQSQAEDRDMIDVVFETQADHVS